MEVIQPKDSIIIKQGNELHLHQLTNKPRFQGIEMDAIIGEPFWSVYRKEQTKGKSSILIRCDPAELNTTPFLNPAESGSDNRNIQDNNDAQSLTKENILSMKDDGVTSQEIMMKLIENSATFSSKTEFAQQKYVRKKAKKYTDYVQILKPNLRLITEIFLRRSSLQFLNMRVDTLSQIMTSVNLQSDGTYLVYENNCQGVIIATMLNALSREGKLLSIATPKYPFDKLKAIKALRFPKDALDRLVYVNVESFEKYAKTDVCEMKLDLEHKITASETNDCEMKSDLRSRVTVSENHECEMISSEVLGATIGETLKRTLVTQPVENKKTSYQERSDAEVRSLGEKKADGLVVVCKQLPNDFVKEMLQFLAPSKSFVVYCPYQEPLVKLYQDLRQRKDVIYVRLFENWLRTYQVLTNQTHPEITMSGTGGYLLTGIKVLQNM